MPAFKTASRTPVKLAEDLKSLDEMFSIVKGANGKMNKNAQKELEAGRFEIAELILTLINDTVLVTDPTPYLVDVIDGQLGNYYAFQRLDSALRVVQRSYGSKPLSQRLVFKELGILTTMKEVIVEIPLEEVAVGRLTPSMVVSATAEAINRYRIANIVSAIDAGVPSGADQTGVSGYTFRYNGFSKANLDNAIDGLLDNSDSPTLFGRWIALAPAIRGFAGFSFLTQRELELNGLIGTYHATNVVAIKDQWRRVDNSHVFSAHKAYLASGTKGAKYQTKDVSFLNFSEINARTATFAVGTRLEDGVMVFDPYLYRIIENF